MPEKWKSGCFGYTVDADGSAARKIGYATASSRVKEGFLSWLAVDCGGGRHPSLEVYDLGPSYCGVHEYHSTAGNSNAWIFRDDAWPYAKSEDTYAMTFIHADAGGAIHDADVEINSAEYAFSTNGENGIDLQAVIIHEAGHVIGLSHSENEDSVMFANYSGRRDLHADDVAAICALYPPAAANPSCTPEPENGLFRNCGESELVGRGCSMHAAHDPVPIAAFVMIGTILGASMMRRLRYARAMRGAHWLLTATLLGACYQVSDMSSLKDASIGHEAQAGSPAGGVTGKGGWAGAGGASGSAGTGGTAGAIDASEIDADGNAADVVDATLDTKVDVADAPAPVGSWSSCTSLHYKGECIGTNTIMYYDDPATCNTDGVDLTCYVSQCKSIGASCSYDSTCGWDCDPKLDPSAVQACGTLAGKCIDGVAIKADSSDSNNCYYKDCAKLSAQCVVKSGKADCY